MGSIHARLLMVASLVLAAFLGLGSLALDSAFRNSIEGAMRAGLQQRVYLLLGAAETDDSGRMRLPDAMPDPRLSSPDSGLYAVVSGEAGHYRWRSRSLIGRSLELIPVKTPGERRYDRLTTESETLYRLHFGITWEDDEGRELNYTVMVAESTAPMEAQINAFRARLFYWLGGVSLMLLVAQGLVLAWGLRPLRQISRDLEQVETGRIERIDGLYPKELSGLIASINNLIRTGRASRDRYRNSLGDLAHSLKTPLSLLRGTFGSIADPEHRRTMEEQVGRMDEIVSYQLRRAASSSAAAPGTRVEIAPVVERLCRTLDKVYREKSVITETDLDPALIFLGDQVDLMEILGNLLENAYKYCRSRVRIKARLVKPEDAITRETVLILVEDDGPGIPRQSRQEVCRRGVRIDLMQPGQGIGLSLATEIVELYGGELQISDSSLGGALIRLLLPAR